MLMSGIYKMVTGSQCLLSCESIAQQPVFVGLRKVTMAINDFRQFELVNIICLCVAFLLLKSSALIEFSCMDE